MIAALRRFLAWVSAPPPAPHRDLARAAAATEPPTTLVVAIVA